MIYIYHSLSTVKRFIPSMIGIYQITGRQISAARALLAMPQNELATASGLSLSTLRRFEAMEGPIEGLASNVAAVRAALEAAGVDFIDENGGGVKLRARKG